MNHLAKSIYANPVALALVTGFLTFSTAVQAQSPNGSACRALLGSLADASTDTQVGDAPVVLYDIPSDTLDVWPSGQEWVEIDIAGLASASKISQMHGIEGEILEVSTCFFDPDLSTGASCSFFFFREPQIVREENSSFKVVLEAVFSGECIASNE